MLGPRCRCRAASLLSLGRLRAASTRRWMRLRTALRARVAAATASRATLPFPCAAPIPRSPARSSTLPRPIPRHPRAASASWTWAARAQQPALAPPTGSRPPHPLPPTAGRRALPGPRLPAALLGRGRRRGRRGGAGCAGGVRRPAATECSTGAGSSARTPIQAALSNARPAAVRSPAGAPLPSLNNQPLLTLLEGMRSSAPCAGPPPNDMRALAPAQFSTTVFECMLPPSPVPPHPVPTRIHPLMYLPHATALSRPNAPLLRARAPFPPPSPACCCLACLLFHSMEALHFSRL